MRKLIDLETRIRERAYYLWLADVRDGISTSAAEFYWLLAESIERRRERKNLMSRKRYHDKPTVSARSLMNGLRDSSMLQ